MGRKQILKTTTIIGSRVRNGAGEILGEVDDIVIDIETGRVAYCVLSSGGMLGIGNKLFAIPMDTLILDNDGQHFILNIEKAVLEISPGFEKDNWPDFSTHDQMVM